MHDYTKEKIDEIKELLPTFPEEQKDEVIRLLRDLAQIYIKLDLD